MTSYPDFSISFSLCSAAFLSSCAPYWFGRLSWKVFLLGLQIPLSLLRNDHSGCAQTVVLRSGMPVWHSVDLRTNASPAVVISPNVWIDAKGTAAIITNFTDVAGWFAEKSGSSTFVSCGKRRSRVILHFCTRVSQELTLVRFEYGRDCYES